MIDEVFPARVGVVILNWNGWRDTLACLDSLLPTLPAQAQVIVCDNASQDDSLLHIRQWADGQAESPSQPGFVQGHALRPVRWVEYDRAQAEAGGAADDPVLVLVRTGANLGFAGGNNVGVRYALARGFDYVWLLNNDTVVDQHALAGLLARMSADPEIGMCGSTLMYFNEPERVQALGGARFDYARGVGQHLGVGGLVQDQPDLIAIEAELDYVVGASMMVTRALLESVGLMQEDYFLYFEEIDWAVRARGRFRLGWADKSIVYHKEGATIGSSHRARPSVTSLRYLYRNRLRFASRHTPGLYWRVWAAIGFEALVYLKRRDFEAVGIIIRTLCGCPGGLQAAQ